MTAGTKACDKYPLRYLHHLVAAITDAETSLRREECGAGLAEAEWTEDGKMSVRRATIETGCAVAESFDESASCSVIVDAGQEWGRP